MTLHPLQWKRKFFHVMNGSIGFWLYAYSGLSENRVLGILAFCGLTSLAFDLLRIKSKNFNKWVCQNLSSMMREKERYHITSATRGLLATLGTLLLCPRPVDFLVILFATYADTAGGIVGSLWGKHKLNIHASIEGTLAVFVVALLSGLFCFYFLIQGIDWSFLKILMFSSLAALVAVFAEGFFPQWDDNVTLPVISGPALWILFEVFKA